MVRPARHATEPILQPSALLRHRLRSHKLAGQPLRTAAEVVGWLGAVQAQDYPAAKWAVGLRSAGLTEAEVEQAYDRGAILRTHVLRPTWHFVLPADLRWMLALSGPRVLAACASGFRRLELDAATLAKGRAIIARALAGHQLTRLELAAALNRAGVNTDGQRLAYIVIGAELEGVVCSGPRRGKQFTYALLDERVAPGPVLTRDRALAELARRYFTSHGPATAHDFAWWSGLAVKDAALAARLAGDALVSIEAAGKPHWMGAASPAAPRPTTSAHLIPCFDEYLVGYRDRSAAATGRTGIDLLSTPQVLLDGRVIGPWRPADAVEGRPLAPRSGPRLTGAQTRALEAAATRYRGFIGG